MTDQHCAQAAVIFMLYAFVRVGDATSTSNANAFRAIGAANIQILLNALAIMLVIVVSTIIGIVVFAWWFRASNTRARYHVSSLTSRHRAVFMASAAHAVLQTATAGGPSGPELFKPVNIAIETACLLLSSFTCGMSAVACGVRNHHDVRHPVRGDRDRPRAHGRAHTP